MRFEDTEASHSLWGVLCWYCLDPKIFHSEESHKRLRDHRFQSKSQKWQWCGMWHSQLPRDIAMVEEPFKKHHRNTFPCEIYSSMLQHRYKFHKCPSEKWKQTAGDYQVEIQMPTFPSYKDKEGFPLEAQWDEILLQEKAYRPLCIH